MTAPHTRRLPRIGKAFFTTSFLFCAAILGACDQSSAENLREWTPADHDHQSKPGSGQVDTEARKAAMPDLTKHGVDDVVLAAWKQNCVQCHGVIGRGDGPQGRALRAPDFTNPAWQRTRIDSEMANAIKNGRGNMPPFGHLPDGTVSGLVKLIRMLNPDRVQGNDEGSEQEVADDTVAADGIVDAPDAAKGQERSALTEEAAKPGRSPTSPAGGE